MPIESFIDLRQRMTTNMWIATCAWLALMLGFYRRTYRAQHVTLMLLGISTDIALVLHLQLTRNAVEKAMEFSLGVFQQLHILASTLALLLYAPIVYLGFCLLCGTQSPRIKTTHVKLATLALCLRSLGFLLMFSMWQGK